MTLASVERPKTTNKLHNDLEIIRTAMIAELVWGTNRILE